jgi:SulP family sulfate permease
MATALFFFESVLTGFVFGLALLIAVKQFPKNVGIESQEGNFFERLWDVFVNVADANSLSVVIGVATIVLMVVLEKYFRRSQPRSWLWRARTGVEDQFTAT